MHACHTVVTRFIYRDETQDVHTPGLLHVICRQARNARLLFGDRPQRHEMFRESGDMYHRPARV